MVPRQFNEQPRAKSPFSILPRSGDQATRWACFARHWNNPTLSPSTTTRTFSIHKTSTLHRIHSFLNSLVLQAQDPAGVGVPAENMWGRSFVNIVSILHTAACSWSALSMGVQGDTQHSCSFCDTVQTKDRLSHTPAQAAEPDLWFAYIYLCCLSSREQNKTQVPPCLASHLGQPLVTCATHNKTGMTPWTQSAASWYSRASSQQN